MTVPPIIPANTAIQTFRDNGYKNTASAISELIDNSIDAKAKNIEIVRKSIVARVDIKKGAVFTRDNLTTKRPGTGISPMQFDKVIGLKAKHNFCKDDLIEL